MISFSALAAVTAACQDCYQGDGETLIIGPQLCSGSQARSGVFFISPGHMGDAISPVSSFLKNVVLVTSEYSFPSFLLKTSVLSFLLFTTSFVTTLDHFAGLLHMPESHVSFSGVVLMDTFTKDQ